MNWICDLGNTFIVIGIFGLLMLAFNTQITLGGMIAVSIIGVVLYIVGSIYETSQKY